MLRAEVSKLRQVEQRYSSELGSTKQQLAAVLKHAEKQQQDSQQQAGAELTALRQENTRLQSSLLEFQQQARQLQATVDTTSRQSADASQLQADNHRLQERRREADQEAQRLIADLEATKQQLQVGGPVLRPEFQIVAQTTGYAELMSVMVVLTYDKYIVYKAPRLMPPLTEVLVEQLPSEFAAAQARL